MKRITTLIAAFALTAFGWQAKAQVLNQNAAWPNAAWTLNGTYGATGLLNDPTATANFTFDDDVIGSGSTDAISAESPIIDLTAAHGGGETWININGNFVYRESSDVLTIEYWNVDAASWAVIETLSGTSTSTSDYETCANIVTFNTPTLDIASFTATQLAGFKYRINYDDAAGWKYGFCFDAPTIVSTAPPTCPVPTALTATNITPTTVDLGWTSTAAAWNIELGTAGFTPTGTPTITGTTTNPHNLSGLTAATSYDFYVKADCAANGVSTWTGPFSFSTTPDYCAGDHFYDNGGNAGNYSNNANETTVICPSSSGDVITATFNTFNTEANYDDLEVYNGNGTGGTSFGIFDGTTIPGPFLSTDITGCLTFVFNSDGSGQRAGWDATITCAPAPSCNAPTALTVANTTATTANLGWTSTAASWDIEWGITGFTPTGTPTIIGTTTNPHNLSGLTAATSYDFYVKADCAANGVSTWAGPFSFSTTPINDNISDAIPLTLGLGACATPVTGTNAGATDSGTPHSCASYNGGDVWYYAIVPAGGILSVEATITTGFTDGGMEAYSGPSSALVSINCDDDDSPSGAMPAIYPADGLTGLTPGDTIWFAVWEYGNNSFGEFEICAWQPPTCLAPTALIVSNMTTTTVDLGWTSTASTWDIELGAAGFTATGTPTITGTTTNPHNLSGLTSATSYDFYVRGDCGGGDLSTWAGPFSFTTPCTTIALPWSEDFESAGTIPNCWSMAGGENWRFNDDASGEHIGANGTLSGNTVSDNYFAWVDASGTEAPATLTSPYVDLSTLINPQISFYEISDNEGNANSVLDVEIWDGAAWNNVATYDSNATSWEKKEIVLSTLTFTGPAAVRFTFSETVASDFYDDIAIDDVTFEEGPCPAPTTLTVANITNTSADLGWTSTATTWDVELGVAGFTATGIPTTASSTTNPTNVTGLTGGTAYDFYVRADCGADSSAWAGPFNFTTTSVGINESANNLGLSLYPNPNNGIFTLNIKAKNVLVKIMNTTGQVVLTKNNVNTNEQIDLSNNAKGIYFVTVTSNEAVTTQKVIVR